MRSEGTQKKILWQWIVEIVGDEFHQLFDPSIALEFLDRLEPKPLAWAVRRVRTRRAVAGDYDGLPSLNLPGELGQPVLGFADGHRFHGSAL